MLAEGADAAVMTRSVPIDKCLSDALIVFAQNGEAIRPEQGYPMRLFLPGWEGNISIKWLRRLEVSDKPLLHARGDIEIHRPHHQDRQGADFHLHDGGKIGDHVPVRRNEAAGAGFYEVTGLAWSGRGKIARVEVSTDGGKTWSLAALQDPVLPICQTRFRFPWIWDGTPAVLQSRATDETGYTQPTHQQLIAERGPLESRAVLSHECNPELGRRSGWEREECASAGLIGAARSAPAGCACAACAFGARTRRAIRARFSFGQPATEQEIAAVAIAIPGRRQGPAAGQGRLRDRQAGL